MQSGELTDYELQQSLQQKQQRKSRLYWQCRRGMLELDCLLQGFFKQHVDSLSDQQLASFEALLKSPDDLLLEYLMGRMVPMDAGVADVVTKIRQSATV
ncbi:FAD assembly factor SdhE [Kaarinaea lacus]